MVDVKNDFIGGLDLDTSFHLLPKKSYADALNITRDALEGSNDRVLTNIIGNRLVSYTFKSGINKNIGSFPFQLRNTTINFNYNSNGFHSVTEFNVTTRIITKIFESRTDSDDIDILNFTIIGKITSVNIYPRENEGDLLFFLDSLGRPTEMDIARFKAGEYTPVTRDIIDKAKKPPLAPPAVVYDNDDTTRSNNLRNQLFRFKYRWIYDDFEKSTFSPISVVTLPVSILSDVYTNIITNNNVIRMSMNTGDKNVKSVEIGMSYVRGTNDWSNFQSVQVIDKSTLSFSASVQVIPAFLLFPYRVIITFKGTVLPDTLINIYATLLPNTQTLIGTYTSVLGDTIPTVGAALVASLASFGIATFENFSSNQLIIHLNDSLYAFDSIDIIPSTTPDVDNIDFSFAFFNDSTYPDIVITESIQLYDFVPPFALAQDMPDGNVLAYGGIREGYNKDTTENAIITVGTIAAGNGGTVGNLSAVAITTSVLGSEATGEIRFSGIPATGTVINLKLRKSSDGSIITGGTYTTIASDTANSIGSIIDFSVSGAQIVGRAGSLVLFLIGSDYEAFASSDQWLQVEIVPPTTATANNSIATWKWSTSRNVARAYFDNKGVTNGILYTDKVTFPAYAENGSQQPLIPFVNYKINDIPPIWAYSMDFYFTKENTGYIIWESLTVQKETAYIYFEVTSFIANATKKPTTAQVCSYAFQDGDRLRLYRNTDVPGIVYDDTYDSAIEGLVTTPTINGVIQPAGSLFIKIKNVSPFTSTIDITKNYVFELYRPTQQTANAENLVYYEFASQWPILDPTLSTRRHSGQVTDQVVGVTPAEFNFYEGDAYFRARTIAETDTGYATFNVMDRNFVDFYISAVNSIDGRPNAIDINAKEQFFGTLIRFGQAYQANTNINGLNRFYPNNFMDTIDYNFGNIVRLKVRDRYLKVFQQFKIGVIPLYAELTKDGSGNVSLIVSDKLLNPIQYRIGNLGLSAPESLASWHFADYGCDCPKGIIWRDSNDGVEPISELYKVDSWATVELPLRNGDSKIYGAIDPKKNQYIIGLEAFTVPIPFFEIEANGLNSISGISFTIVSLNDFKVDWGDGTIDSFLAGTRNPTHTYSTPYTGEIKVVIDDLSAITSLNIGSNTDINPISGALSILTTEIKKLTNLTLLNLGSNIYTNGIASDLPSLLTFVSITNTNLSGGVSDLPTGLLHVNIQGNNSLTGTTSQLPTNITFLILYGANTLSGNVSGLPRTITTLYVYGNNILSGDVAGLPPNLNQVGIHGFNILSGDVAGFPSTITFIIDITGSNTISGDISDLPTNLIDITLTGNNTISGDIATAPSVMTFMQITGNNTLGGDLAFLPVGIKFIYVGGSLCTINGYTNGVRTWNSTMNTVKIAPVSGGLSTTEVDNLLIELAAQVSTWIPYKIVSILGGSSPRSAASNAAVATLTGEGVTVTTN